MAGLELQYPVHTVVSIGTFDSVVITLNVADSGNVAPGIQDDVLRAISDALTARPEFTGATITRTDLVYSDIALPAP
jgi:hypothetical protein